MAMCKKDVDLLPNDPFGMGSNSSLSDDPFEMDFNLEATFASIYGWIEEFGLNSYGLEADEPSEDISCEDNKVSAELNSMWTGPKKYGQREEGKDNVAVNTCSLLNSDDELNILGGDMQELLCFGCEKYQSDEPENGCSYDGEAGVLADVLRYALEHLSIIDLLSVESVCKSLRDEVQDNPPLWRNIHIDYPLSNRITDDDLLRLTSRAQGTLESLNLVKCFKVTNEGLRRVLDSNLDLSKLSVPGCMKIKVEGLLHDLKAFNSVAKPGIKQLRIGSLYGLTDQHFKEFKLLLKADEGTKSSNCKPRFYRAGEAYLSLDDDHAIDIETCPICLQTGLIYDCPEESCRVSDLSTKPCRACRSCIPRCVNCGCCLDNKTYEETFSLDLLCCDCFPQQIRDRATLSPTSACPPQRINIHYFGCG